MWRTFQLGSTVSKIPEDCFKIRDTFMKLAGRKKTAFITELFKKCLMIWWKQFHTANLKIDPVIKHYTQFRWYYIKRSKKFQHESCIEQIHFPCIFGTMKVCMDQHINHRKGNLKRSVCISGTTVFKIKIQVILQRIQNFIIGWLDLIKMASGMEPVVWKTINWLIYYRQK